MPIANRTDECLLKAFDETFWVYNMNGFTVTSSHVDPEFESLEDAMNDSDIVVHWVPAQQHVPEIERTIRTVKDGCGCACQSLPFQAIPKVMIKALAKRVVKFVNVFPQKEEFQNIGVLVLSSQDVH